jgi:beta-glucosidase
MVLLKNDGILPIRNAKRIAVVGPLADQTQVLLGNYTGTPTHITSVMEGMRAAFPQAQITFVRGTQFLSNATEVIPSGLFTTPTGQPGLQVEYRTGDANDAAAKPPVSRTEATVELAARSLPPGLARNSALKVRWSGFLQVPETGDYRIGIKSDTTSRITVAGRPVALTYGGTSIGRVHLSKGEPATLEINYEGGSNDPKAELIWQRVNDQPDPAAIAAARNADVVVAVVGITSSLEGEEMPVSEPGFEGGDRTSIDVPEAEEALVRAVASTGKPVVVVLMNGSALAARWEKEHANAILEAWYSGEEGGTAIGNTLSGKNNPAGRLPVTFYEGVHQLPRFEDYSMKGRTYRYFTGEPLWPFGYGLSYTSFVYGDLALPTQSIAAGQPLNASIRVTNAGSVAGDEVVQLYLKFPNVPGAPLRALRGFRRIHLAPGAGEVVGFDLKPRDLSMVTEAGEIVIPPGTYTVTIGGGQPGSGAASAAANFVVRGEAKLTE